MYKLLKSFEQYKRYEAELFSNKTKVSLGKYKCFLWLPDKVFEEPHFYILVDNPEEYHRFNKSSDKQIVDIKITMTAMGGKEIIESYLIKEAHFSSSNGTYIAPNWFEGFIKYHFPKYVIRQMPTDSSEASKFRFYISDSDLLKASVFIKHHWTGEIRREPVHSIYFEEEVAHLGIKSINTDSYIGNQESNLLEIESLVPVQSFIHFYKTIKPTSELILLISSFAERKRLSWYKCDGEIGSNHDDIYNTRVFYYDDPTTTLLISPFEFENYLKTVLLNITRNNVKFISNLLRSYLSGTDYSVNAKIILWNSILEKILKKHFGKKKDNLKSQLLQEFGVYTADLHSIQDLINIRNDVAHGDDYKSDVLFRLYEDWQILIERVILRELKWYDLSKTDVGISGQKPYGL